MKSSAARLPPPFASQSEAVGAPRTPSGARLIRYYLAPYPGFVAGIMGLMLLVLALEGLYVAAFFPLFQSLVGTGLPQTAANSFLGKLQGLSEFLPTKDPLLGAGLFLLGITLLKSGMTVLKDAAIGTAAGTLQHDLKNRLMRHYAESAYPFFLDHKQGKLLYNASSGASRVGILIQKVPTLLTEALKVGVIGFILFASSAAAAAVVMVMALSYYALTKFLARRISFHTGTARTISGAEQVSIANEFLTGIHQIMTFETFPFWLVRFRQQSACFRDLFIKDSVWLAFPKAAAESILVAVLLAVAFSFNRAAPLAQQLPLAGLFAMGLIRLLPSLTAAGQLRMEVMGFMGDAQALYEDLETAQPRPQGGSRSFTGLRQSIDFDQVGFAHKERKPVLQRVTFRLEKGKVTALVGPSGSGKTTLVNLLLGLLLPTEGRILVDGTELMEFSLEGWRRAIGFVAQEPFIAHATAAENILFGRKGFSQKEIERAAAIAHADGFIRELPQGYNTLAGERGMKLSGGQRQRLAIARAVLGDPLLLIFDEATSALDTLSERAVQEAMQEVSRHRTVLVVAHRLSTVRGADKIVVLEEGRVMEEGSHEALMRGHGRYAQLAASS